MSRLSRFLEIRKEKKKQKIQKKLEKEKEKEQSFYKKMYGHDLSDYKPFISERYDFLLVYLEYNMFCLHMKHYFLEDDILNKDYSSLDISKSDVIPKSLNDFRVFSFPSAASPNVCVNFKAIF